MRDTRAAPRSFDAVGSTQSISSLAREVSFRIYRARRTGGVLILQNQNERRAVLHDRKEKKEKKIINELITFRRINI